MRDMLSSKSHCGQLDVILLGTLGGHIDATSELFMLVSTNTVLPLTAGCA